MEPKATCKCVARDKNVYNIFNISKLFGIFPFHLKNGYYYVSVPFCIVSAITSFFVVLFTIINTASRLFLLQHSAANTIDALKETLSVFFNVMLSLLYTISLLTSFSRTKSVNEIVRVLGKVDRLTARAVSCWSFHRQSDFRIKNYLGGLFAVICFPRIPLTNWAYFVTKAYSTLLVGSMWLTASQFSVVADLIISRVDEACMAVNDLHLSGLLPLRKKKLMVLSTVYDRLCDICAVLNASFAPTLTLLSAVCFCGIFIPAYLLLFSMQIDQESRSFDVKLIILSVITVLTSVLCVWQVVSSVSWIFNKLAEFNTSLYQLMMDDKTNEILGNEKLWLHISMKREVVFTACGFFKLDYTLIHSMVASSTTYLVILIQFGQPSYDKPPPPPDFAIANITTTLPVWSTFA